MAVTSVNASPSFGHRLRAKALRPAPCQSAQLAPNKLPSVAPRRRLMPLPAPAPAPEKTADKAAPLALPRAPNFQQLTDALLAAKLHPDVNERQAFIRYFNTEAAPRLTMEEAYLQWLCMRMVRLYMPLQTRLQMNIQHDRHGAPVRRHGSQLVYTEVTRDNVNGGTAHLFEPGFWGTYKDRRDAIVVFGGTAAKVALPGLGAPQHDVLLEDYPQGLKADVDRGGIGKTAFAANRGVWLAWARRILGRGQRLTIVGYSLGGALATRLMAELTPEEQKQCRLFTFQAPGIDTFTALHVVPGHHNVVMIDNPGDNITKVGASHPAGVLVETQLPAGTGRRRPHVTASLTVGQLNGVPTPFVEHAQPHPTDRGLEHLRQVCGLAQPILPA